MRLSGGNGPAVRKGEVLPVLPRGARAAMKRAAEAARMRADAADQARPAHVPALREPRGRRRALALPWSSLVGRRAAAAAAPAFVEMRSDRDGHHVGPRERDVAAALSARDVRRGMRVLRLRQRRLDGPLLRQLGSGRLLHAEDAAAQRALQEQSRRHVHRRHGTAGVPGGTFGMGVAVGDYDNDGYPDLFVTAYGRCTLYHNNGNGTFTDVTKKAGLDAPGWTTSAVWFDYDNDGKLDLFVCSFVAVLARQQRVLRRQQARTQLLLHSARLQADAEPAVSQQRRRHVHRSERRHRHPARARQGARRRRHRRQRRRADGFVRRERHGAELPVRESRRPGERQARKWEEMGLPAEVAFSANGQPRSGMGVDAADFDQDGLQDLFVANVDQEMFSLYKNRGGESFSDVAHANGVAQATRLLSGWGLKFFDYDNDGHIDLLLANGHPDDMIEQYSTQVKYKEPLLLFRQQGGQPAGREPDRRSRLHADLSRPRPRRRRSRQRRQARRRHLQQRRGAAAAEERVGRGPSLARRDAPGHRRATATRSARA